MGRGGYEESLISSDLPWNKNPADSTRESAGFGLEGAVAHATGRRDGRQEGRESSYYVSIRRNTRCNSCSFVVPLQSQ